MALIKKPVTGMKDIMPEEMLVRDYVMGVIKETYKSYGFTPIETPCVENIENLSSKQGGENEKLIFKILKRGEKLKLEEAKCEADLVDGGLRYDLTVPLVRYYSNNSNNLPNPFKAVQMGSVWRADRPQKGRYRQFTQCDIDILGEATNLAEIELICATSEALSKLGFKGFQIKINDRALLKAMAAYSGFSEDSFDEVFIILDKMDKIGMDGVEAELKEAGYNADSVDKYLELYKLLGFGSEAGITGDALANIDKIAEKISGCIEPEKIAGLKEIIASVNAAKTADFDLVFDPTLVRGMSYYTGTIYEIYMPEFGAACGGGGRYDKMVGNFTGKDVPACGFSIGFERIIMLLMDNGFKVPGASVKKAYLLEKGLPSDKMCEVLKKAQEERSAGAQILVAQMNKNKKFQKEQLGSQGYTEFVEFFNN